MITLIAIIVSVILSFILTEFLPLPWYTPMIVTFLVGLLTARMKVIPFLMGFLSVSLFWLIKAIIPYLSNNNLLIKKIAHLFTEQLGITITPIVLLLLTLIIGGLLGGLAALSGNLLLFPSSANSNRLRRGRSNRRKGTYKLKLQ